MYVSTKTGSKIILNCESIRLTTFLAETDFYVKLMSTESTIIQPKSVSAKKVYRRTVYDQKKFQFLPKKFIDATVAQHLSMGRRMTAPKNIHLIIPLHKLFIYQIFESW